MDTSQEGSEAADWERTRASAASGVLEELEDELKEGLQVRLAAEAEGQQDLCMSGQCYLGLSSSVSGEVSDSNPPAATPRCRWQ